MNPITEIKYWINDQWDSIVWRLYKRTHHYYDGRMHEMLMHCLLDDMGAPKYPNNDPKRPAYGSYGRLSAWCKKHGYTEAIKVRMPPPETITLCEGLHPVRLDQIANVGRLGDFTVVMMRDFVVHKISDYDETLWNTLTSKLSPAI